MPTEQWDIVTPGELGDGERARWESVRSAVPSYESPFLSAAFASHVGAVRRDARVGVLRDRGPSGPVLGFVPFHTGPTRLGRPIGRRLSDAQGPVVDPAVDWDPRGLLRRAGLRALTFDHLVEDQPRLAPYVSATAPSPQLDLRDGFDAYLGAARAAGLGGPRDAGRKHRRLERAHELRFTWNERDPAALRTLLSWKSEQYRRTGAFDQTTRPWVVELLERLHASEEPGCSGVLTSLHAGNDLVALHFALRSDRHLASWFPVYDPSWAEHSHHSPGFVLLLAMARMAAENGVHTFDLGKGSEPYKERWATGVAHLGTAVVTNGPIGAGLGNAGRIAWGVARRTALQHRAERLRWRLDLD